MNLTSQRLSTQVLFRDVSWRERIATTLLRYAIDLMFNCLTIRFSGQNTYQYNMLSHLQEEVMNLKRPTLERENLDLDPDGMNRQGSSFEMSHITSLTDYSDSTSGSASVPLPQNK